MSTNKKRQHQIPRTYLERFADTAGFVWTYDIHAERITPAIAKQTAVEGYLYSVTLDDGSRLHDLEDFLSKAEEKADPLIDKFLRHEEVVGQERADLSSYFALMYVRTNWYRRQYAEAQMKMRQAHMYAIAQDDRAFAAFMKSYEAEHGAFTEEARQQIRKAMIDPSGYEVSVASDWTVRAFKTHDAIVEIIFDMVWSLLLAPDGRYFITSDNPLVKEVPAVHRGPLYAGGFKDPHIQVTLPLSHKACWLGHWRAEASRVATTTPSLVKETNKLRAIYAEQCLFADRRDSGIMALGVKHRDVDAGFSVWGFGPEEFAPVRVRRGDP